MVYCGRPSKGCAPCRIKRTKCDLQLPSCGQCIRTSRICTGYRKEAYGEFRDQSKEVSLKQRANDFRRRAVSTISSASSSSSSSDATSLSVVKLESDEARIARLKSQIPVDLPCPEDGVACFFFNDYVITDASDKQFFNFLPSLYNDALPGSVLHDTILALGMSSLSTTLNMPKLKIRANAKYAKVLQSINVNLRDSVAAKHDETLIIVNLLGLFEEINTTTRSLDPWTQHVHGSLALLNYRGEEQLDNQRGLSLIRAVRQSVITNCLLRRVEVPKTMLKWTEKARERESAEEAADSEFTFIIAEYCSLQATLNTCNAYLDPVQVVTRALSLDENLMTWGEKWQHLCAYDTIYLEDASPDVFSNHWHLYRDVLLATLWNIQRGARILVNNMIIEQLTRIDSSYVTDSIFQFSSTREQIFASRQVINELSYLISCSIPTYVRRYEYNESRDYDAGYSPRNTPRVKLIIWPIYVAGQAESASDELRLWAAGQLEKFGTRMGIPRSTALGALTRMKQKAQIKQWKEYGGLTLLDE